jgi:hypothetical protein
MHGRCGSGSGTMQARLGHRAQVEAHVWAREELRITGLPRACMSGARSSPVALMAGGGGWLGRARKWAGGFKGPRTC